MNGKQPYELTREEFQKIRDENTPDGNPIYNSNGSGRSTTERMLDTKTWLSFGAGKFVYDQACHRKNWALDALAYSYDLYDMVMRKAAYEGLLPAVEVGDEVKVFSQAEADAFEIGIVEKIRGRGATVVINWQRRTIPLKHICK